jgi:hypothetical protein
MLLQFIDKGAAALPDFRRIGSFYAMNEFGYGNGGDHDSDFAKALPDGEQEIFDGLVFSFGFDDDAGIDD